MTNFLYQEAVSVINALPPVDINGSAKTTAYIRLKYADRVAFIITLGAWGTATPAVTTKQATDSSGTGAKTTTLAYYWVNSVAATSTLVQGAFYRQAVTSNTFNLINNGDNAIFILNFWAGDLDLDNGFNWLAISIADPAGAGHVLGVTAHLYGLNYPGQSSAQPLPLG